MNFEPGFYIIKHAGFDNPSIIQTHLFLVRSDSQGDLTGAMLKNNGEIIDLIVLPKQYIKESMHLPVDQLEEASLPESKRVSFRPRASDSSTVPEPLTHYLQRFVAPFISKQGPANIMAANKA